MLPGNQRLSEQGKTQQNQPPVGWDASRHEVALIADVNWSKEFPVLKSHKALKNQTSQPHSFTTEAQNINWPPHTETTSTLGLSSCRNNPAEPLRGSCSQPPPVLPPHSVRWEAQPGPVAKPKGTGVHVSFTTITINIHWIKPRWKACQLKQVQCTRQHLYPASSQRYSSTALDF